MITLKSDGEPAIVAVREALARCHGGRVTPEQPPKGEHQANGLAEVTGRHVRDQVRVMKLHLEKRLGRQVLEDEPVMAWMIRWAAMAMSRYKKGKVGLTPYERQKGRRCEVEVVPFGEVVMYRLPEVANDKHQALERRWSKGLWLGHARHTPEAIIATDTGIVKAWAVRRLPAGQQWDDGRIRSIKGSPTNWRLDTSAEPRLVEVEDRHDPALNPELGSPSAPSSGAAGRAGEKRSI